MRKLFFVLLGLFSFVLATTVNAAAPHKTWTFLIFLNGKNNLDQYGKMNLKDMEKVGSNDQVNIVVEWGSYATGKTVRMLMKKSADSNNITSPILEDLGSVDMGSYKTLEDFIQWGVQNFPADHYFIDVWDHGSGWHLQPGNLQAHTKKPTDISWDDLTGSSISTEQLGVVMKDAQSMIGHKVDIYGSDACLMGMAEVADEMSYAVDYFVGSQETEPGKGWPYADLLSAWESIPNATAEQVAKLLVHAYVKSYENGSNGNSQVTFSAYNMNELPTFNAAVAKLGSEIHGLNQTQLSQIMNIAKSVQTFAYQDYRDVLDFANKLMKANIDNVNQQTLLDLQTAILKLVTAHESTSEYKNANGISIWLPTSSYEYNAYSKRYDGLRFSVDTQWNDTLRLFFNKENLQNSVIA